MEKKPDKYLAMVISFALPGVGQWYVGRKKRAIPFLAVWIITAMFTHFWPVVCVVAGIDAYEVARKASF